MTLPNLRISFDEKTRTANVLFLSARVARVVELHPGLQVSETDDGDAVAIEIATPSAFRHLLEHCAEIRQRLGIAELTVEHLRPIQLFFDHLRA